MSGPFYDLSVTELMAYDITWDMSTTEERHQLEEQIKAEDPKNGKNSNVK